MVYNKLIERNVWCLMGLPFDEVDLFGAEAAITFAINNRQRCFLTTPNLNFLITAQSDVGFFQSVVDSDLSIADGMPIIWVAKLLGVPLTERVAGSDLFDVLSKDDHGEKTAVFFFGGQDGVAERACEVLNQSSNGMHCCGFYGPGFVSVDEMSGRDIIESINNADPDFLLVALGAGKGQAWIQKNREQLDAPVISHLGAVVNFVAGNVVRAPVVWQRYGLEWLWRIRQEPGLWRRYFFDGLAFVKLLLFNVFPLALYDRWLRRSCVFKSPVNVSYDVVNVSVVQLGGSVYCATLDSVKGCFADILQGEQGDVLVNCADLVYVDAAFFGTLMLFQGYLNEQGRLLYLQNVPKCILRLLSLNNVLNRFHIKG